MKLTDTCACGATITLEGRNAGGVHLAHGRWLSSHANCARIVAEARSEVRR